MKLDADYYMEKLIEIEKGLYRNTKYINAKITIPILKQIARDGAEAQRNKCFPDCNASNSCPCNSATIEWGVKGE